MPNTFTGDADNNYIVSANGEDIIYGLDGVDELHGRGGIDQLFGGNGEDSLFGEDGVDTLDGGTENDQLDGGYGNDTLIGGTGDDTFVVNDDIDTITDFGLGNDILSVGPGAVANATVVQAWTATTKTTNDGVVNLKTAGFAVDLSLAQGSAGFTVTNTGAATTLIGSALDDTLNAGAEEDTLIGGGGNDMLVSTFHTANVLYTGGADDYTVTNVGLGRWQVVDTHLADGDSGTDTLVGVQTIIFANTAIDLPVNHAPVLDTPLPDMSSDEDFAVNLKIPEGTFSDPDGNALALSASMADGSPLPDWLSFDAETNTFSGTPPLNFNGVIALKVTAGDGEFDVSDTFKLTINPVNDAPFITSGGGGAEASYTVLENSRNVTTVTSSDPDAGAYKRFAIVGGADASLFTINGRTGALIFKDAPSFENAADADQDNVYDVVVRASDGRLSDAQTLHVTVSNIANEILKGTVAANNLLGAEGIDRLFGYSGSDMLDGGAGNDLLYGGNGGDILLGGLGSDRLYGGEGEDTLTGGAGRDFFVFDMSPNASGGADVITDFSHAQGDRIMLSRADFSGFDELGRISADQFHAADGATTAHDASDRIIYNTTDGALYYDADGLGGADAVQIATIQSHETTNFGYYDILISA